MTHWLRTLLPMQETQETQVWPLGQKDPLEKDMATHSSILVWKVPQTEEPGGLQSMVSQRVRHNWTIGHSTQHRWKEREREKEIVGGRGRKKAEEGGLSPKSYTLYKNQTKWDHTLKHKHGTIKILEKKKHKIPGERWESLQDLGPEKEFLYLTPSNLFF